MMPDWPRILLTTVTFDETDEGTSVTSRRSRPMPLTQRSPASRRWRMA